MSKSNDTTSIQRAPTSPYRSICLGAALIAVTLIAYLPAFHGGFLLDDDLLLTNNALIKDTAGWWRFWCTKATPDYLPLMSDSFWIEWRLWGMNAVGYHATNIVLHAASAILFWLFLKRLNVPGAWLGALIFAVHPVNVRSVAWIAERKNTLAMVFYLSALLTFMHADDRQNRKTYWLSLLLFVLALLSKSSTVVLPVVLLILIWYKRSHLLVKDLYATIPFFAASALAAATTIWYQYHVEIRSSNISLDPLSWRTASAGYSVWFYLEKLIDPTKLAMIYPRIQINTSMPVSYAPTALVVLVLCVFAYFRSTWGRVPLVVFGYYVVTLLPVLGFVNMAFFKSSMVSDHLQYIPMLSIAAFAGAGLTIIANRMTSSLPKSEFFLPACVVAVLSGLTFTQAGLYVDRLTLARDTLNTNPSSFWANGEVANALMKKGDLAGAEGQLLRVLVLDPRSVTAYNNLAAIYIREGRYIDASSLLIKVEKMSPENIAIHMNLGVLYSDLGYVEQARAEFERAAALAPGDSSIRARLNALRSVPDNASVRNQRLNVEAPELLPTGKKRQLDQK